MLNVKLRGTISLICGINIVPEILSSNGMHKMRSIYLKGDIDKYHRPTIVVFIKEIFIPFHIFCAQKEGFTSSRDTCFPAVYTEPAPGLHRTLVDSVTVGQKNTNLEIAANPWHHVYFATDFAMDFPWVSAT